MTCSTLTVNIFNALVVLAEGEVSVVKHFKK